MEKVSKTKLKFPTDDSSKLVWMVRFMLNVERIRRRGEKTSSIIDLEIDDKVKNL